MARNLTIKDAIKIMNKNFGDLDLEGTAISSLPDNLTVGGYLYLQGTQVTNPQNYKRLRDGDHMPGEYLYADGILTHIKREQKRGIYTYYTGKIKGRNVISDGINYAHCKNFKSGVADLIFKSAEDRGADQYKGFDVSRQISRDEMRAMYHVVTGSCGPGIDDFITKLGDSAKDTYSVEEVIQLTKEKNAYRCEMFMEFFEG